MQDEIIENKRDVFPLIVNVYTPIWMLLLVGLPIFFFLQLNLRHGYHDPFFIISNGLIGCIAVSMLLIESHIYKYSLNLMHWVFNYIFLFIAPLIQYFSRSFPWGLDSTADINWLVGTNVMILTWDIVWIIIRIIRYIPNSQELLEKTNKGVITRRGIIYSAICGVVGSLLWIKFIGVTNLFTRASLESRAGELALNTSLLLLLNTTVRGLPVAMFSSLYLYLRNKNLVVSIAGKVALLSSLFLVMITNFPTGAARFWIGAIYLGLLILVFGPKIRRSFVFPGFFIAAFLVGFPLLNVFRTALDLHSGLISLKGLKIIAATFKTGDFDAYTMTAYTLKYISDGPGITLGRQIIGVFLFFVPRSLWPTKPIGSGWTVATHYGFWPNVSSPPQAEGLINFGILGLILFAIILCGLFSWLDRTYWRLKGTDEGKTTYWFIVVYPFLLGLSFLMMRGDLMSSYSYSLGFITAFLPLLIPLFAKKIK